MPDSQYGLSPVDPHLVGVIADLSAIRATTTETHRRIENLERTIADISELTKALLRTQSQTDSNSERLNRLEHQAESIDKNIEGLATHEIRLTIIERDLIKNGEFRVNGLERLRTGVFTVFITALVSASGYVIATFLLPLVLHK